MPPNGGMIRSNISKYGRANLTINSPKALSRAPGNHDNSAYTTKTSVYA